MPAATGALEGLGGGLGALRSRAGALGRECIDDEFEGFIDGGIGAEVCAGADGFVGGPAPQAESAAAGAAAGEAISRALEALSVAGELSASAAPAPKEGEGIERAPLSEHLAAASELARQARGLLAANVKGGDGSELPLRPFSLEKERFKKIFSARLKQHQAAKD